MRRQLSGIFEFISKVLAGASTVRQKYFKELTCRGYASGESLYLLGRQHPGQVVGPVSSVRGKSKSCTRVAVKGSSTSHENYHKHLHLSLAAY